MAQNDFIDFLGSEETEGSSLQENLLPNNNETFKDFSINPAVPIPTPSFIEAKKLLIGNRTEEKKNNFASLIPAVDQNGFIDFTKAPVVQDSPYITQLKQKVASIQKVKVQRFAAQLRREETAFLTDEQADTVVGGAANVALSLAEGAIEAVIGFPLKAGAKAIALAEGLGVTDQDIELHKNIKFKLTTGKQFTAEEEEFFRATPATDTSASKESRFDKLERLETIRRVVNAIDTGITAATSFANSRKQQIALDKVGDSAQEAVTQFNKGEVLSGVGTVLKGIGKLAIEDTAAAIELAAQTLPQMFVLAGKAPVALAGASSLIIDQTDTSIQEFKKEHGREATSAEKALAGIMAVVSVGLDTAGAKIVLKGLPGLKSIGIDTAKKTVDVAKKSIAKRIIGAPISVAKSGVVEGATEAAQSVLTQFGSKQDISKIDVKEAITEGTIGAVVGKGLRAGTIAATAAKEVVSPSRETARQVRRARAKVAKKLAKKGIGHTERIIKEAQRNKDPVTGINAINQIDFSEVSKEDFDIKIKEYTGFLSTLDKDIKASNKTVKKLEEGSKERTKTEKELKIKKDFFNKNLATVNKLVEADLRRDKPEEFRAAVKILTEEDTDIPVSKENTTAAIEKVVNNVSTVLDIGSAVVSKIFGSTKFKDNATTEQKKVVKDYLNFQEAKGVVLEQRPVKGTETVHEDVIHGGEGFVGINQHIDKMKAAIQSKNKRAAGKTLKDLKEFRESQIKKLLQGYIHPETGEKLKHAKTTESNIKNEIKAINAALDVAANMNDQAFKSKTKLNLRTLAEVRKELVDSGFEFPTSKVPGLAAKTTTKGLAKDVPIPAVSKKEVKKEKEKKPAPIEIKAKKEPVLTKDNTAAMLRGIKSIPNVKAKSNLANNINTAIRSILAIQRNPNPSKEQILAAQKQITIVFNIVNKILPKSKKATGPAPQTFTIIEEAKIPLNQGILIRGIGATVGIKEGEIAPTSTTYLKTTDKGKGKTLLRTVTDLFGRIGDPKTRKEIRRELGELSTKQLHAIAPLYRYREAFVEKLLGTDKDPGIIPMLKEETIFFGALEGKFEGKGKTKGNPFGYLIQETPDGTKFLNENLLSAMAMVTMNWVGTQSSKTLFNDFDAIRKILGLDENANVNNIARELLTDAGVPRNTLIELLGKAAFKQTGLEGKSGIDGNFIRRLEHSMGTVMVAAMLEGDQVTQKSIKAKDMKKMVPETFQFNPESISNFIRVDSVIKDDDVGHTVSKATEAIQKTLKESDNVLQKLFDIKTFEVLPTLEADKKAPEKIKQSFMGTPKKLQKAIVKLQAVEQRIKTNVLDVIVFLDEDNYKKLEGYEENVKENFHESEVKGIVGKNNSIQRDYDALMDFTSGLSSLKQGFFFAYEVIKNHRVMMTSSTVNTQRSKIHRHVMGAKDLEVEIQPNAKHQLAFKQAIISAFGTDPGTKNKKSIKLIFNEIRKDDVIKKGVAAIKAIQTKKITKEKKAEYQADILAAVEQGGEKSHTLEGLVALAAYRVTIPFTTNIGLETDGITNGVIIGLTQSMLEKSMDALLAAGGVFLNKQYTDYSDYKDGNPTNLDSYERLAALWQKNLSKLKVKFTNKDQKFLTAIFGEITGAVGRKLSKAPLMTSSYGASARTILENLENEGLDNFYITLRKLSQGPNPQANIDAYIESFNLFTGNLAVVPTVSEVLTFKLTTDEAKFLKKRIKDTYGEALKQTLQVQFPGFKEFRTVINNAFIGMFEVFNAKYERSLKTATQQLNIEAGVKKGDRQLELSQEKKEEILLELVDYFPAIKTAMSDGVFDRLLIMDTEQVRDASNPYKQTKVDFGKEIKNTFNPDTGKPISSFTGTISDTVLKEGGVGGLVKAIQSMDSAINAGVFAKHSMLNIFDAGIYNLLEAKEATKTANKAFFDNNINYSIIQEVENSLKGVMIKIRQTDPDLIRGINKKIADNERLREVTNISQIFRNLAKIRVEVDKNREQLEDAHSISQFALPGSGLVIKDQDIVDDVTKSIIEGIDSALENIDSLGSTPTEIDFENFSTTYAQTLSGENSVQIFDALDTLGNVEETPERQKELKNILTNLVNKVIGPLDGKAVEYDLRINEEGRYVYGGIKEKKIRIVAGGSRQGLNSQRGVIGNLTQISAQETLVHELVHAISSYGIDNNFAIRKQLRKLFDQVKAQTSPLDFLPRDEAGAIITAPGGTSKAEFAAAKERYEHIFDNPDSLHEFLTFGLTNKHFNNILSRIKPPVSRDIKGKTWKEKFINLYLNLLDWINNKVQGTENLNADEALLKLTENLVGINTRYHSNILNYLSKVSDLDPFIMKKLNKVVFEPIVEWNREQARKTGRGLPSRAVTTLVGLPMLTLEAIRGDTFHKVVTQVMRMINLTEQNVIIKLARETLGLTGNNLRYNPIMRDSNRLIDQQRKHVANIVTSAILDRFDQDLTRDETIALNKVGNKTDIEVLFQFFTPDVVLDMVRNTESLNEHIESIQKQLAAFGNNKNYYIKQARGMGYMMASGRALQKDQMISIENIVNLTGLSKKFQPTGNLTQARELVDQLGSLYALKFTSSVYRDTYATVMEREIKANPEDNGIAKMVYTHRGIKKDAREQTFVGSENLMIKGFVQETYNPAIEIIAGLSTEEEEKKFKKDGWKVSFPLKKDPDDPNQTKQTMYIRKYGGLNEMVQGGASLTNMTARGTSMYQSHLDMGNATASIDAIIQLKKLKKDNQTEIEKDFLLPFDPNIDEDTNHLIPTTNNKGKIVSYRYMMTEQNKDSILEKSNDFAVILGKMAGNIVDKRESKDINRRILQETYDDFIENFNKDSGSFVEIGPRVTDPRLKEIYDMMPEDMKFDMKNIWNKDTITVREELIDMLFGFRKMSFTDKYLKWATKHPWGQAANLERILKISGSIWKEVISAGKDWIVIKSGVVLRDNIISNNMLLLVKGVPIKDVLTHQGKALSALNEYQKKLEKRDKFTLELRDNPNLSAAVKKSIKEEITQLTSDINTNPIKDLVDEGIFQSIIEDIAPEGEFSHKRKILDKIGPVVDKHIPDTVTEVFKQIAMTQDTFIYKKLLQATQYSDFIARYALYQHLTINKNIPKEKAIVEIVDTFINYDIPTSPELQWLNDMGILMFTKFLFRIQRVILRTFIDNPINAMALQVIQDATINVADIPESSLFVSSIGARWNFSPIKSIENMTHPAGLELFIGDVSL